MPRGPLIESDYKPQFSGHETFPLRYGWLKKVCDRVLETQNDGSNRIACWGEDAIARFGVGKNMVGSMRHWAKTAGVIEEKDRTTNVHLTELGNLLFGPEGVDPYMENPATSWLVHWQITARADRTTWYWVFSHYPGVTFERDDLVRKLEELAKNQQWQRVARKTIQNDVQCFIRSYVAKSPTRKSGHDDALESPLTELGLIKAIGKKDGFRLVKGAKPNLGNGVFLYSLAKFWESYSPHTSTLSFESISHAPGSPGRLFAFDEEDVLDRLTSLEHLSGGTFRWSETAGLKQVVRGPDTDFGEAALRLLAADYGVSWKRVAA